MVLSIFHSYVDLVSIIVIQIIIFVFVCAVLVISETIVNSILTVLMRKKENKNILYKLKREISVYRNIYRKIKSIGITWIFKTTLIFLNNLTNDEIISKYLNSND